MDRCCSSLRDNLTPSIHSSVASISWATTVAAKMARAKQTVEKRIWDVRYEGDVEGKMIFGVFKGGIRQSKDERQ